MSESRINVAIVDDDDSVRRSLGQLLKAAGFNPAEYPSAEAYLEDSTRARMHCLVLDIHLRGMSGFDLHKRLRESGIAPPVIYVTAYDMPGAARNARRLGCVACFIKPVRGDELLEAVGRATGSAGIER